MHVHCPYLCLLFQSFSLIYFKSRRYLVSVILSWTFVPLPSMKGHWRLLAPNCGKFTFSQLFTSGKWLVNTGTQIPFLLKKRGQAESKKIISVSLCALARAWREMVGTWASLFINWAESYVLFTGPETYINFAFLFAILKQKFDPQKKKAEIFWPKKKSRNLLKCWLKETKISSDPKKKKQKFHSLRLVACHRTG